LVCSGIKIEFLPPYSPDFNPIEEGFSGMKHWIRRHGHSVRAALNTKDFPKAFNILSRAVNQAMTPENIAGWFRHSGYV
jgi:transposase